MAVSAVYTAAGGLTAVLYTDVLQAIVLLVGACLVTLLAFAAIDFDWSRVVAATEPGQLELFLPLSDPNLPWLGTLVGVPVLGFYFWCTNQFIVQRVLGARSLTDVRRGALFAGLLKLPVLFIMVIPGVIATLILPPLDNGDQVFPALVGELLPLGVRGLVLAALVAALMSSIDSTLNSASALLTLDFIKPSRPELTPRQLAWIGRGAILLFMLLSAAVAPPDRELRETLPLSPDGLGLSGASDRRPLSVVGSLRHRPGPGAALATLIGGHGLSMTLFVLTQTGLLNLHFTLVAGLIFGASLSILAVAGLMGQKTSVPDPQSVWTAKLARPEAPQPWWQDYRTQALVLLLAMGALVWAFR